MVYYARVHQDTHHISLLKPGDHGFVVPTGTKMALRVNEGPEPTRHPDPQHRSPSPQPGMEEPAKAEQKRLKNQRKRDKEKAKKAETSRVGGNHGGPPKHGAPAAPARTRDFKALTFMHAQNDRAQKRIEREQAQIARRKELIRQHGEGINADPAHSALPHQPQNQPDHESLLHAVLRPGHASDATKKQGTSYSSDTLVALRREEVRPSAPRHLRASRSSSPPKLGGKR